MVTPAVLSIKNPISLKTTKEINGMWYADLEIEKDDYFAPKHYIEFENELYITGKLKKTNDRGK